MIKLSDFSLEKRKITRLIDPKYILHHAWLSFGRKKKVVLFSEEEGGVIELFEWLQYRNNHKYVIKINGINKSNEKFHKLFITTGKDKKTEAEEKEFLEKVIFINLNSKFHQIELTPKYILEKRFGRTKAKTKIKMLNAALIELNWDVTLSNVYFFQMGETYAKQVYLLLSVLLDYELIFLGNVNSVQEILLINKIMKINTEIAFVIHSKNLSAINLGNIAYIYYGSETLEWGTPSELFYYPQHPYLWDIIMAMPKFYQNTFQPNRGYLSKYVTETKGDPYAPRNKYATNLDFEKKPPLYQLSDTHFARTFLLNEKIKGTFQPPLEIKKRWEYFRNKYHE